jgi:hypothetical protein
MTASFVKVCRHRRAFDNELFVYQSAFPNKASLIEIRQPQTIILSRINGIPYLDTPLFSDAIIAKLAAAIGKLHALAVVEDRVLCHWDNQPRNILWDEKQQKLYLLDFEDIRLAPPEADIAHLFLFWAEIMEARIFSHNVGCFLACYKGKIPMVAKRWKSELRKARNRFDSRRRKHGKTESKLNQDRAVNRRYLSGLAFP